MEKVMMMRSLYRSICRRSSALSATAQAAAASSAVNQQALRRLHVYPPSVPASVKGLLPDCRPIYTMGIGNIRFFSEDVTHTPNIKDPEIERAFKDLMAATWSDLPPSVLQEAKTATGKATEDKSSQVALANVLRAAEAVEEFNCILKSLRMAIDDAVGLIGEDVKPLPEDIKNALRTVFERYVAYLDAFSPEESYLKKKVETELGTNMIHLKMRCSGLGSEWGKVTVLGTSGISGSYIEQRA